MSKASKYIDETVSKVDPYWRLANSRLSALVNWVNKLRQERLTDTQFTYILAIVVGVISGIVAIAIKNTVRFVQWVLTESFLQEYEYFLYIFYPLIGILITLWIIRRIVKHSVEPGIPNTLHSISKRNGLIGRHNMFSSLLTSAITMGFGGSAGLEGPTVGTTSAYGANIGTLFKLPYKTRALLIGCAASGAMASLFNAPIAAIVFAIEVIMLDLTTASLIPLLLASASAAITSTFFLGDTILFHFRTRDDFEISQLPYYIVLGVLIGLGSVYFFRVFSRLSEVFDKIKNQMRRTVIAGVLLGLIIMLFPALYGEGYEAINAIIDGQPYRLLEDSLFEAYDDSIYALLLFCLGLGLFKVVATTLTLRAGGVGGIFAPTLFMGAMFGFAFSRTINHFGLGDLPESNFTLVAMAGLMAGNLHAPLMAIFLIAEITGGYELFVPLMVTSAIAFLTVKRFVPYSIYTAQLARRGELLTHDKDQAVLTLMKLHQEIEKDFVTIGPYETLGDLVKVIARSKRNLFPVLSEERTFLGVVNLNEIRHIIFDKQQYESILVHDLMNDAPEFVRKVDTMEIVMSKFESSGAWNLPVLNDDGTYVGFVSKSKLFSAYRKLLRELHT